MKIKIIYFVIIALVSIVLFSCDSGTKIQKGIISGVITPEIIPFCIFVPLSQLNNTILTKAIMTK